ncbi:gametocyte-specific factor 1 [Silurus meridionalis]|uniref:CHHC U11-48K-type domain-containing protein n=2 Tax=Silurus meridionalis TaxID=175797 RepID=A0A8T0AUS6_SILME|nr:hypothetical protein HF521_005992 [Silurus meridionalis]KAI5095550.1 gametocyte-specific factor 1 [Silurus meridionalis]
MSTFRYGSSVGPSRFTGNAQGFQEEDEGKPVDDADPNAIIQCPYDKNHQIRACRFPFHIVKCAKNHPELARSLKTCPFNAKHMVPRDELANHIAHCVNKQPLTPDSEGITKMDPKFHVPMKWTAPDCEEDWETETDDNAATFVWGVSKNLLSVNKPEPRATNILNPGVRAPRTLPWKSCEF